MKHQTLHQESSMRVLRSPGDERKYRVFTRKDIDSIPSLSAFSERFRNSMKAVSAVLPFRVNNYVIEDLIDWSNIPEDPIFQLTFPQPEMLDERDFKKVYDLVARRAPADQLKAAARKIQLKLNPHPAGQLDLNVPTLGDERLEGM